MIDGKLSDSYSKIFGLFQSMVFYSDILANVIGKMSTWDMANDEAKLVMKNPIAPTSHC